MTRRLDTLQPLDTDHKRAQRAAFTDKVDSVATFTARSALVDHLHRRLNGCGHGSGCLSEQLQLAFPDSAHFRVLGAEVFGRLVDYTLFSFVLVDVHVLVHSAVCRLKLCVPHDYRLLHETHTEALVLFNRSETRLRVGLVFSSFSTGKRGTIETDAVPIKEDPFRQKTLVP